MTTIAERAAALAADAPPLTPGQIASLATLLATASAHPDVAVDSATVAEATIANRPSRSTKRDEERHARAI